jgi:hypothetical protein
VVHAVGANVLLNVGVFVVVDPKTDVAGGLWQVGDQASFSNWGLTLQRFKIFGNLFFINDSRAGMLQ